MEAVVALEDITRRFGYVDAAVDVSIEVHQGEVFGLLGHNGAGKTTLIRLINGLLRPDAGRLRVFDLDPAVDGHRVRQRSGVLTTYPGLDEYLSPSENLAVYAAIHGLSAAEVWRRSHPLLERLGISPSSREPARALSAGLKQRVALARALIHDPELLLLDEPTANLDPIAARNVRSMVRELAGEGRTVIFSTHNLAEAEALCDRVAILRRGHVLAVGSLRELADERLYTQLTLDVGDDQGPRAAAALRPLLNGHETRLDRDRVTISGVGRAEVPDLLRTLVESGVDVRAAVPQTPSLEDVYLSLHESGAMP